MSLPSSGSPEKEPVFQAVDWFAFCLTSSAAFVGYLLTLAPEVTLEFSGLLSTGAMYAGVPHPPGYPIWTIYAWLFTLLPFSNIAWRVALSSAVAASLASGLIALMVSRAAADIAEPFAGFQNLTRRQQTALRTIAGFVAGLSFAFDAEVWRHAVIADTWALSLFLLSAVLCLLMRWFYAPGCNRYLYAAFFLYGLAVCNSQILLTAALGLHFLVMLADPELGREIFFADSTFILFGFGAARLGYLSLPDVEFTRLDAFYLSIGFISTAACATLIIKTRRLLGRWRVALVSATMFVLGVTSYFYVPLASMTTPPVNWGYARTVTGFFHLLTRGQYERIQPTETTAKLLQQVQIYGQITASQFGLPYVLLALIPFCVLSRIHSRQRAWILGLSGVFLCLTILVPMLVNPSSDRQSRDVYAVFFSASHIVLALWTGYGVVLGCSLLSRLPTNLP